MADTKNVYEQLTDLQNQLAEMKSKPRTLQERIDDNDPDLIEFIKNAKPIWRYTGDKSELKRENKKLRIFSVLKILIYFFSMVAAVFMISYPFGWIFLVGGVVSYIMLIVTTVITSKPRAYELRNDEMKQFGKTLEYDDNNIIVERHQSAWLVAIKVVAIILPFIGSVYLIFTEAFIYFFVLLGCCLSNIMMFFEQAFFYYCFLVDGKTEIKYHLLKDFMKRNKLK